MKKPLLCLLFLVFSAFGLMAQTGTISGKVIDEVTGEEMVGATVIIKDTKTGATSDLSGNYKLKVAPGKYTLVVSYISYNTKEIEGVEVVEGKVTTVNITLSEKVQEVQEVVITAKVQTESQSYVTLQQKNAATVSDGISAENIRKTPDRTTGDVLKRVSGAAIQDNRFAIIRGLNERYNAAYINGAPLPSSESDRKAFSFDIFPSNLLDNLVILKTASPDLPGEFVGGIIQINTRSIPASNFQTIGITGGYNTITTFKKQLSYTGGKYDWLGIDDGRRALPKGFPDDTHYPTSIKEQANLGKQMPNDWGLKNKSFLPNMGLQYTLGRVWDFKNERQAGAIVALTYNRFYNQNTTIRRSYDSPADPTIPVKLMEDYTDQNYSTQTQGGLLANFAYKASSNHEFNFKNLLSIATEDRVIHRTGSNNPLDQNPKQLLAIAQWFTSNRIYTGQLNGSHFLPVSKLKVNWTASYSSVLRTIPALRRNSYSRDTYLSPGGNASDTVFQANVAQANVGPDYAGNIFYSTTNEKIYSGMANVSRALDIKSLKMRNELKAGGLYQFRDREFTARQLGYIKASVPGGAFSDSLLYLPPNQIFAPQNMGQIAPGVSGFALSNKYKPTDSYTANSRLVAAYAMFDSRIGSRLRVVAGVRMESFEQNLFTTLDNKTPLTVTLKNTDFLPSANIIYSLTGAKNLRLSYSHTVNRPEFREMAPFAFYDFSTRFVVSGNSSLTRALVKNYDVRYEWFPGRGQLFSASAFYKDFSNPIEQIARPDVTGEITYRNVSKAHNYGMEFEIRIMASSIFTVKPKSLLDNVTVFANVAIIKSAVDVSSVIGSASSSRPLQGQSPYIINGGIQYNDPNRIWSFSANYNRVGQRIFIVGSVNEPDIWENGRDVIDLQLSRSFLKDRLEVRLNVRDLLAQKQYFFQDHKQNKELDLNKDNLIWITNYGRTISFNVNYKL